MSPSIFWNEIFLRKILRQYFTDYTIKGWGKDGSDIEAMRIVVHEDLTLEIMRKMMAVIVEWVGNMISG